MGGCHPWPCPHERSDNIFVTVFTSLCHLKCHNSLIESRGYQSSERQIHDCCVFSLTVQSLFRLEVQSLRAALVAFQERRHSIPIRMRGQDDGIKRQAVNQKPVLRGLKSPTEPQRLPVTSFLSMYEA